MLRIRLTSGCLVSVRKANHDSAKLMQELPICGFEVFGELAVPHKLNYEARVEVRSPSPDASLSRCRL